jgi:hypothetical protein
MQKKRLFKGYVGQLCLYKMETICITVTYLENRE